MHLCTYASIWKVFVRRDPCSRNALSKVLCLSQAQHWPVLSVLPHWAVFSLKCFWHCVVCNMFYVWRKLHVILVISEPEHAWSDLNLCNLWLRALGICTRAVKLKASCSNHRVSTILVACVIRLSHCLFFMLMGLSSSWRLHLAAWLGQRRPSSLLFVGSMNVSWTFPPYSVGGMGLIVSALQNWYRFRCVVALAGASQAAVVSAVVLSTAVVVPTAVPQAVASGPLVQQWPSLPARALSSAILSTVLSCAVVTVLRCALRCCQRFVSQNNDHPNTSIKYCAA